MAGGWKGSTRRDGLPSWWPVTQRRIIKRDPVCRCPGCVKCYTYTPAGGSCIRASTDADHIGDKNDHHDTNLRGMCGPCHDLRSSQQGNEARAELRRPSGFMKERHPGDIY